MRCINPRFTYLIYLLRLSKYYDVDVCCEVVLTRTGRVSGIDRVFGEALYIAPFSLRHTLYRLPGTPVGPPPPSPAPPR